MSSVNGKLRMRKSTVLELQIKIKENNFVQILHLSVLVFRHYRVSILEYNSFVCGNTT